MRSVGDDGVDVLGPVRTLNVLDHVLSLSVRILVHDALVASATSGEEG